MTACTCANIPHRSYCLLEKERAERHARNLRFVAMVNERVESGHLMWTSATQMYRDYFDRLHRKAKGGSVRLGGVAVTMSPRAAAGVERSWAFVSGTLAACKAAELSRNPASPRPVEDFLRLYVFASKGAGDTTVIGASAREISERMPMFSQGDVSGCLKFHLRFSKRRMEQADRFLDPRWGWQ